MNHSDYHNKTLGQCVTDEAWADSLEAHLSKIEKRALKEHLNLYRMGMSSQVKRRTLEVLLAIGKIEEYVEDEFYKEIDSRP